MWHEDIGRSTSRGHLSSSWNEETARRLLSFSINIGSLCKIPGVQHIVQVTQIYLSTRCERKDIENVRLKHHLLFQSKSL